ncbi:MAG: BamA/TamA family outer membrane protein, partial [Prevotella sp.]|nr:BamA/TamA family outer membrane protein [Prevotella sp.]
SYLLQNGDIKLVFNLEYRRQLFGNLHAALFLDAGNVWTKNQGFENETDYKFVGETNFRFNHLFRDLAVGSGIGLRYDLDFLILRLDWGVGLHVPYDTGKSGFYNISNFKDCQTLHFAIGYPF